jgi:cephalosporin hydroxylase
VVPPNKPERRPDEEVVRDFHLLYYRNAKRTWENTFWLGKATAKCPFDMWIYQEILFERQPDLIIETGTFFGGSAHFFACMCDMVGKGRVVTIDVQERQPRRRPKHPRLEYRIGSSTSPEVVAGVQQSIADGERVMVILDSDHRKEHVLDELAAYSPFVTPGDYMVVEDTNVNGNPIRPHHGPGPGEAVAEFIASSEDFYVDDTREKYFMTFNPGGYLRRKE